jgi:excisionase family DNA binding protein
MLDYSTITHPVPYLAIPTQAVIDQTLQLVASDCRRRESHLGTLMIPALSLAQLRAGPLGQDLRCLALVAAGQVQKPQSRVLAAIDVVLRRLFSPAGADDYAIPRPFWETDLGRLLARAKYQAFGPADLLGIATAAEHLGVSRPTVYRWMDDRSLDSVHDEISGRTFVVRHGVDLRLQVAAELLA